MIWERLKERLARWFVQTANMWLLEVATAARRDRDDWKARAEQAEVQLAGCLCAAEGHCSESEALTPGDYGYSIAFEKVSLLRRAYESFTTRVSPAERLNSIGIDN